MNSSQIHLALTHIPVVLSFVGLVMLIVALLKRNDLLTKTSFYIFLMAGLFALPVYFTGEDTEEIVEHLPGISESIISRHEQFATISLTMTLLCAAISLAGLVFYKYPNVARLIRYTLFAFAFGSAGAMAQTAHLGGQIRHTEIRSSAVSSDTGYQENINSKETTQQKEE
jgi:biotin transporter BioY